LPSGLPRGSFSDAAGLAGRETGELDHAKIGETRPSSRSRSDSRGMRVLINVGLPTAAPPPEPTGGKPDRTGLVKTEEKGKKTGADRRWLAGYVAGGR